MRPTPFVTIVIVTWNKKDCILNLLNRLKTLSYDNYKVVVVDNASTDGTTSEIKKSYPHIKLVTTETNLGGTGGFNLGIATALKTYDTKYIWLLDNDAIIEEQSLVAMVDVMENHPEIGQTGSLIVNPDDPELVVELGLNIDWYTGVVHPYLENEKREKISQGIHKVDYVPACSTLLRASLLKKCGLMDERYFLWWDDAELGMLIRSTGSKVAGVPSSVVYHPTEKGWIVINYYNLRNCLLFFSKHVNLFRRAFIFYRQATYVVKGSLFALLTRERHLSYLNQKALLDYFLGRWGMFTHKVPECAPPLTTLVHLKESDHVLVLPNGNLEQITETIQLLRKSGVKTITLAIQDYRKNLFSGLGIDHFILFNDKKRMIFLEHLLLAGKLLKTNFSIAITPDKESRFPFGYTAQIFARFDENKNLMRIGCRIEIWKVFVATFGGYLLGIPLACLLLLRSFSFKRTRNV